VTAAIPVTERSSPPTARPAAVVTWAYAAGFGLSTVPVSTYLLKRGSLPWLGFALPIPWLLGAARVALVAAAWKRLRVGRSGPL
jgi:hypothetical protein